MELYEKQGLIFTNEMADQEAAVLEGALELAQVALTPLIVCQHLYHRDPRRINMIRKYKSNGFLIS